jgi:hypothetical protein
MTETIIVSSMGVRVGFGHTACPYYTSTFGAEYHHWFNSMIIPNSMIVDDWFTAAKQLKQVLAQMSQMSSVFESIGFRQI